MCVCEEEGEKQERAEKRKRGIAYTRSVGLVKFKGTVGSNKVGKSVKIQHINEGRG